MSGVICWLTRRRLGAYQDGELAPAARAKIAAHLERCPACDAELSALGRLRAELAAVAPEPPEAVWAAFWPQVRTRLAAESFPASRPRRVWESVLGSPRLTLGSALAAAALLVVVTLAPWRDAPMPPEGPPVSALPSPTPSTPASPVRTHVVVQAVETADPNSSVMVFANEEPDVTVVWVFGLERT
ncbi:MAG: anti-sigma factor family protein [bacterium]